MVEGNLHTPNSQPKLNPPPLALRQQDAGFARLLAVAAPSSCEENKSIRILRLPEVMARVGLRRASIYAQIHNGNFPKQISLGARAVGWLEHEADAWLAARIGARCV
jgi:prophage regulatory protein